MSGLYHFRNRDYSASLGRWISVDPIRFHGGDVNLYGYVGENLVGSLDPLGLVQLPLSQLECGLSSNSSRLPHTFFVQFQPPPKLRPVPKPSSNLDSPVNVPTIAPKDTEPYDPLGGFTLFVYPLFEFVLQTFQLGQFQLAPPIKKPAYDGGGGGNPANSFKPRPSGGCPSTHDWDSNQLSRK